MKRFIAGFVAGSIVTPSVVVGLLIVYVLAVRSNEPEEHAPPVLPITDADYDWTLTGPDGEEQSFTDYKGKTVFLTFFRPTCGTCISEFPNLQRLYEETRGDGVAFIMVATAEGDKLAGLPGKHGLTMPLHTADDYPAMYKTGAVPTTVILSPEGKVVMRHRGAAQWDDASVVNFLRELAAPRPPK